MYPYLINYSLCYGEVHQQRVLNIVVRYSMSNYFNKKYLISGNLSSISSDYCVTYWNRVCIWVQIQCTPLNWPHLFSPDNGLIRWVSSIVTRDVKWYMCKWNWWDIRLVAITKDHFTPGWSSYFLIVFLIILICWRIWMKFNSYNVEREFEEAKVFYNIAVLDYFGLDCLKLS